MRSAAPDSLLKLLWPPGMPSRIAVWAILDGARDQRIFGAVDGASLEKCCLFAGDLPWQLQLAAPYLVRLEAGHRFTSFLLDEGWNRSWGVFVRSESSLKNLRRHFRGLLRVRTRSQQRLLFRFYDPRVLRAYLPTCNATEIEALWGPVGNYFAESGNVGELLRFSAENGAVVTARIGLENTAAPHWTPDQPPRAAPQQPLLIRDAQLDALRRASLSEFEHRLERHLTAIAGPPAGLAEAVASARSFWITAERDIVRFCELMLRHTGGLSPAALPKPARNILMAYRVPAPEKLSRFEAWALARQEASQLHA